MSLERVDHMAAIEPDGGPDRATKMAVNMRVGEALVLQAGGQVVRLVLEQKHGQGARLVVHAPRSVQIQRPD